MSSFPVPTRVVVEGASGLRYAAYVDEIHEGSISLLLKEPLARFDRDEVRITFRAEGRASLGMVGKVKGTHQGRTRVELSHPLDCALLAAWMRGEDVDLGTELEAARTPEPATVEVELPPELVGASPSRGPSEPLPGVSPTSQRGDDRPLAAPRSARNVLLSLVSSPSAPLVHLEQQARLERKSRATVAQGPTTLGRMPAWAWPSSPGQPAFGREALGEAFFDHFDTPEA